MNLTLTPGAIDVLSRLLTSQNHAQDFTSSVIEVRGGEIDQLKRNGLVKIGPMRRGGPPYQRVVILSHKLKEVLDLLES